jgi:hypothetical protein
MLMVKKKVKKYYLRIPGVNVRITVYADFNQFSAKMVLFLGKHYYVGLLFRHKNCILSQTPQFFANFVGKNILKITTSAPGFGLDPDK